MGRDVEKLIVVVAGPNGAGKTTFFQHTFAEELEFINADEIAAELCPEDVASVALRAGRMMLERIAARVAEGKSFAIETTLSGRGWARSIPKWRDAGYQVYLHFLTLPDSRGSINRVASRVREGGHVMPEDVIRRRFDKGLENFYSIYRDLVDHWDLHDNSGRRPRLIDSGHRKDDS